MVGFAARLNMLQIPFCVFSSCTANSQIAPSNDEHVAGLLAA